MVAAARAADADTDVRDLTPDQLQPGTLAELTSPSLFAERKVVVVRNAQDLSADTVKDVLSRHLSAAKVSKVTHGLKCGEKVVGEDGDRQQVVVEDAAGDLKEGDVIVQVGSRKLSNRFDLERSLWGRKAGDSVPATVLRDGKPTAVAIMLVAAETRTATATATSGR